MVWLAWIFSNNFSLSSSFVLLLLFIALGSGRLMMITPISILGGMLMLQAQSLQFGEEFPFSHSYLSDDKVIEYRKDALQGNIERAIALSDYYDLWKDDRADGEFWGRLAAEFGGCQELRRYYYRFLRFDPYRSDVERVRTWIARRDKACEGQ